MSRKMDLRKPRAASLLACALGLAMCASLAFDSKTAEATRGPLSRSCQSDTQKRCYLLEPALGKSSFATLTALKIGGGNHFVTGQIIRADGTKPDRVLQLTGSSSTHRFVGDGDASVRRRIVDLTYSMSKIGTDPANAFLETGAVLRGHYHFRLKRGVARPAPGTKVFAGHFDGLDWIGDWRPPLTGPSATYTADNTLNAFSTISNADSDNYLGGIRCHGTHPVTGDPIDGFDNCGTVIPINNTGDIYRVRCNEPLPITF